MKLLILCLSITGMCLASDTASNTVIGPVGRYRLFEGETLFVLPTGHTSSLKTLWKIDTCSGRAWHFFSGASNGKTSERWVETFDRLTSYSEQPNDHE